MSNIAISFEHVGKMYQLGTVGTGTLSNDIKRWWYTSVLNREDPFLKVGQTNDRASKSKSDFVYALRDITFDVEQGDVIGLIGKNGAGKSTLLKLLSRITAPTTGVIKAKGRIASLLEVGTGFVSELTGRENIYMNGSIMGMTKHEIDRKLDEIIDFSGCEMYIDTPVKRYSSGMQVRLGFAVAAFLEPEILVVDEVLAVGDAEFQRKAIGKMQDVASNGGRTVLFVSHNMASVRQLCRHGVVLRNGMVEMTGTVDECVDFYMSGDDDEIFDHTVVTDNHRQGIIHAREVELKDVRVMNDVNAMAAAEPLVIRMKIKRNDMKQKQFQVGIVVNRGPKDRVGACYTKPIALADGVSECEVEVKVHDMQLVRGSYSLDISLCSYDYMAAPREYDMVYNVASFKIAYLDAQHTVPFNHWHRPFGSHAFLNSEVRFVGQ